MLRIEDVSRNLKRAKCELQFVVNLKYTSEFVIDIGITSRVLKWTLIQISVLDVASS